jgi:hypothetical protein
MRTTLTIEDDAAKLLENVRRGRNASLKAVIIEAQFRKYKYPADGYPEIQMYYRYGGAFIGTMNETNRYVKAYRAERLPFVVNQAIDLV